MHTFVRLTSAERASHERKVAAWLDTLRRLARDTSDPETCAAARLLLRNRGERW